MVKIRVEYDRKNCIGAGSCAVVDPEKFFMDDDGKATLRQSKDDAGKFILEGDFSEEDAKRMVEAAQACPVNVIKVFDKDKNQALV